MCEMCKDPTMRPADYRANVMATIEQSGWMVQYVDDEPPYAYTIGQTALGLPELLVSGVPPQLAARILNDFARRDREGLGLHAGQVVTKENGWTCRMIPVRMPGEFLLMADDVFGSSLRALQIVYRHADGRWPGRDNDPDLFELQILYGPWRDAY